MDEGDGQTIRFESRIAPGERESIEIADRTGAGLVSRVRLRSIASESSELAMRVPLCGAKERLENARRIRAQRRCLRSTRGSQPYGRIVDSSGSQPAPGPAPSALMLAEGRPL